ncbi:MAG TPA: class I SAM-dependent methyltransferase [Gemmataceae bacterium]|nr:class I SAM-dependent methyltransferase [Gemmataceae bacterium]
MTQCATPRRQGSYGIDAPYWVAFVVVVTAFNVVSAVLNAIDGRLWPIAPAVFLLALTNSVLYTTLRGKFVIWADLLDQLNLRGDERILDLGYGRGAVLLMAAQRLTTGRAVGVDLWKRGDQSGNAAVATQRNAVAEGVADRGELHTADMTALPLADDGFDLVLSSLAIHNSHGRVGRDKAIDEAARVLRPGGRLAIADIRGTRQYRTRLIQIGMSNVVRRRLGWRFWWGGPWAAVHLVTAVKPEGRKEKAPS